MFKEFLESIVEMLQVGYT
jgi:hypothetical protein